jgi:hypothetical protein
MELVGVCFQLVSQDSKPVYLFPSLASFSSILMLYFYLFHNNTLNILAEIKFSMALSGNFQYYGLQISTPLRQVFTAAVFCQLIVGIFATLNVSILINFFFFFFFQGKIDKNIFFLFLYL